MFFASNVFIFIFTIKCFHIFAANDTKKYNNIKSCFKKKVLNAYLFSISHNIRYLNTDKYIILLYIKYNLVIKEMIINK